MHYQPSEDRLPLLPSPGRIWDHVSSYQDWFSRRYMWYYVTFVLIIISSTFMAIYHKEVVEWLTPMSLWLSQFHLGWLIPIPILSALTWFPLFGYEIVAILCGFVWGIWIGFGIVAVGTFIGEIGDFIAFQIASEIFGLSPRQGKLVDAGLNQAIREDGFKIALAAKFSIIPGHVTTAISSTCELGILPFLCVTILSSPRHFLGVSMGAILRDFGSSTSAQQNRKDTMAIFSVLSATIFITSFAMGYVRKTLKSGYD